MGRWILAAVMVGPCVGIAGSAEAEEGLGIKSILLLAQGPDGHPGGTHEYVAGVRLLETCLERDERLEVAVEMADDPWEAGPALIASADCVVLYLSEGAAWLSQDTRRLEAFARHADRGGGLVAVHWAMGTREARFIDPFVQLFGGCHGGPDRRHRVVETRLIPVGDHPITRGIGPIDLREEFYFRLKRIPVEDPNWQAVMSAEIDGFQETVAWAWVRPDGGRSFGFSGAHFHQNWQLPEYRRLVVQAVIWASHLPPATDELDLSVAESAFALPADR